MAGLWPQRLPAALAAANRMWRCEKHGVHLGAGKGLRAGVGFAKGSAIPEKLSKIREIER
jgi:hypothetical protein